MIDVPSLIATYRAACLKARIDPIVGPITEYESVNAITEAIRLRPRHRAPLEWWEVDWGRDPGFCHSTVERYVLKRIASLADEERWRLAHPTDDLSDAADRPYRPLSEVRAILRAFRARNPRIYLVARHDHPYIMRFYPKLPNKRVRFLLVITLKSVII